MTTPEPGALVSRERALNDDVVAAFLRADPEFFLRHPELLGELEVPHDTGGAVSLVERKLKLMNEEIARLKARHRHMVQVAEANAALHARVYALALELVEAPALDALFDVLSDGLTDDFNADAVTVWLDLADGTALPATAARLAVVLDDTDPRHGLLGDWVSAGAQCGRLTVEELGALFPGAEVGSAVVLPFDAPRCRGVVAIGSRDAARFATQLATDALEFLAAAAAARIDARLEGRAADA